MSVTMGEMTVTALVTSALHETVALSKRLDSVPMSDDDRLVIGAYVGSIMGRIANAEMKLGRS